MIYASSCKGGLTSRPNLPISLLKLPFSLFKYFLKITDALLYMNKALLLFNLIGFFLTSTDVLANLNAAILFCSRDNNVTSIQSATTQCKII